MAELSPIFLDSLTYPAKDFRKFIQDLFTEGILSSGALAVTESSTPAMSVSVALGRAVVESDEGNYGSYIIENDDAVTKTVAASDPSNARIDRVIAQVYDATDSGGSDNEWAIEVLTGTPAASPSAPALPDNALDIALIAVAAGVTTIVNANITDQRTACASDLLLLLAGAQTITGVKSFSATPKTDAIAEKTSDTGVTIDGILLKDDLDTSGIVGKATAQTLTNKRNQHRVYETTSLATLTPEISTYDEFYLTAQAANLTIANHSTSTPAKGEMIMIDILPDDVYDITYGTNYVEKNGVELPEETVADKRLTMIFRWIYATSKYSIVWAGQEA